MQRLLRLALCLSALLLAAAPSQALAERVTLKMATLAPKGSVFHRLLGELGERWKEASGGDVQVKLYPGGVAGSDEDVVRKIRLGTLSGGLLTSGGFSRIHKAVHALQIPMAYESDAEFDFVLEHLRPELATLYEKEGFVVLCWLEAGWVRFLTKTPVATPDELAKLKLQVNNADAGIIEIWKASGLNPVPLPTTEISTALQTGLVDAVPVTPQAANLMQWNQHAKYLTDVRSAPLVGGIMVSKAAWDKIDPELRPKLAAIAVEIGKKLQREARPADRQSIEAMKARGLTVVPVNAAALDQWRKRVAAAKDRIRGAWTPAEFYDKAIKLRDTFRKHGGFTDGQ